MKTLANVQKAHIITILAEVNDNRTHAAEILGISKYTLARLCKKYGIPNGKPGKPAYYRADLPKDDEGAA